MPHQNTRICTPLVERIVGLHTYVTAPFDVFVAETLRRIGLPIADAPAPEAARQDILAAIGQYFRGVEQAEPFADILGPVFSEVSSAGRRSNSGQFFTPWELSVAMAELTLGDWKPEPHPEGGLWRVLEPACGSGALLLAAFQTIVRRHGPDALRLWHATAIDLDLTLARTCALQVLVAFARPGWAIGEVVIRHGNSLSGQMHSTVLHATALPRPEVAPPPAPRRPVRVLQPSLFDAIGGAA